jgi:pimeloyl-ACP methyl ester carboxylesterase
MLYLIPAVILAILGILALILVVLSPGGPAPLTDENGKVVEGSISEKITVNINGVQQGMIIQSNNAANPVLLFLHGGMPEFFLTTDYPTGLEDIFTVVWWEQRGSGISYSPDFPQEQITLDLLVSDTLAVTNYLRERFDQEKIYLMGHSGGSFIGVYAAAREPELYHAYIGTAQMSNQLESERLAYEYMLEQFRNNGNKKMVKLLEAAPVTLTSGTPMDYLKLRDPGMHALGIGTMHDMKYFIPGIFLRSLANPNYTLKEKLTTWRGKFSTGVSQLWPENISTDLAVQVPEFVIPVYFLEGKYDFTVSTSEARQYFDQLTAPVKGFYLFEYSAHSPLFEEPEKACQILEQDVLKGTNHLADFK